MKLLKLELCNFRGVSNNLCIEPKGENLVILGANGTGKSTLVDAIDFLLSGTIDRLLGEGTGGVTLGQHGHHVDASPEEAWVCAEVALPGVDQPVRIERRLGSPQDPVIDDYVASQFNTIITLARNGQHILTRREVLRYVHASPSKRGERMQELLGLSEIKRARDSLVRVRGDARNKAGAAKDALLKSESALAATIKVEGFDEEHLLAFVNEKRVFLQVDPLADLKSGEIPTGINLGRVEHGEYAVNPDILDRDVDNLNTQLSPSSRVKLGDKDARLREAIHQIHEQPALHKALQALQLTRLGIDLLDESGDCPLCDTAWPAAELRAHLEQKLATAEHAERIYERITNLANELANTGRIADASIKKIAQAAGTIGDVEAERMLHTWRDRLEKLVEALNDPLAKYLTLPYTSEQISSLLTNGSAAESISRIQKHAREMVVRVPPEQTAYELLIRLSTELERKEKAVVDNWATQHTYHRAQRLLDAFEHSRDHVLGALYDNVRNRFEGLYRQLHTADESEFSAILESDGAGVTFEVDYLGRGKYPPIAIHSEGHQDSMGVCLFLALAEHINQGKLQLVVLDDVLMAIDSDHRRAFSRLLKDAFPDRQFLITTHDRTWANQLRHQGVITAKGFLEITHWDIESGPRISSETDVWEKIDRDLFRGEIAVAAARLRRGSEEFYGQVCHQLRAKVPYNMTGRYELGDFLPAAQTRYKELLKKAKAAANSWNNEELRTRLIILDKARQEAYSQLNGEQWAVNPAVHYNNWENFSRADFLPVVEAFQNLQKLFACQSCESLIQLVEVSPSSVRCRCGQFNWNLENK